MNLADIMDIGELDRLVAERYITRRTDESGRYTLHNYTEKATYDRVWTAETKQCRGIVSLADGTIVARPFDKFFNVDESEETRLLGLLSRPGEIEITDKLDGSMVAVWFDEGWHTSTRGSFTSSQAQAAAWWLSARARRFVDVLGFTLLCEWCAPDNRVVLKYDAPELFLIGARRTSTGTDIHYSELQEIANLADLRLTPRQTGALEDIAAARVSSIGREGWVARWPDGFRVKIKTEDYLRLHRLVTGFNARRVRDVLLASGEAWTTYLTDLPEEFRAEAERMANIMQTATVARLEGLQTTFERLRPLASESRKAYAMAVLQEPSDDRPYLFGLIDKKPIADKVLMSLDLEALGLVEVVNAE
jgi:putative RNA ligase